MNTEHMNYFTLVLVHTFAEKCIIIIWVGNTLSTFIGVTLLTVIKFKRFSSTSCSTCETRFFFLINSSTFLSGAIPSTIWINTSKETVTVRTVWCMIRAIYLWNRVKSQLLTAIGRFFENLLTLISLLTDNQQRTTMPFCICLFSPFLLFGIRFHSLILRPKIA